MATPLHAHGPLRTGHTPTCCPHLQEMARCLILVENANVNAQDNAGWTPLHEACCNRNTQVAELLLRAGADANMSAADGTRSYMHVHVLPFIHACACPSIHTCMCMSFHSYMHVHVLP